MLGGILKILFIIGLIMGVTYLIPDDVKKNVASKLGGTISNALPKSVKEKMEPIVFSPAERRQKLLDQLEKNIESIKAGLAKSGEKTSSSAKPAPESETTEEITQKLEETEKIIKKIQEMNKDQGVVNKVTTKIYKSVTGGSATSTNETCPSENK
ncbi:MAG: hypothetical protein Q8R20_01560 [Nanoarchaeota archaeon]|nr:hypothetical protein [Nanoarchaeota archaeon]